MVGLFSIALDENMDRIQSTFEAGLNELELITVRYIDFELYKLRLILVSNHRRYHYPIGSDLCKL